MAVPARNNGFGNFTFTENCVETNTSVKSDGTRTSSQTGWVQQNHSCRRAQKSKNLRKPKGSSGILFISPSSYDRGVRNVTYESGVWSKTSTGTQIVYQEKEGPPNVKASWSMLSVLPMMGGDLVSIDNNLNNQARTECLIKLKGAKASLGADMAEGKQTVRMLAQSAKTLGEMLKAAKRGQWHLIPKQFKFHFGGGKKTPANMWLELNYGWLPLMGSIHDLTKVFLDKMEKPLLKAERRVADFQSFQGKEIYTGWESSGQARRTHSCVLYAAPTDAFLQRMNKVGVTNPLSIGWEVTRLSFVVDWLIPVGDFLEALDATMGLEFIGGYTSQWCEGSSQARLLPPDGWEEHAPRTAEMEFFSMRRQRLTGFPAALPYIKSPFSTSHVASAIALIHQLKFK